MGKSLRMKFSNTKIVPQHGEPDNALNYRSLRLLDGQKLRFCLPVSLMVRENKCPPLYFFKNFGKEKK
ncbi:hypothetical protein EAW52_25035 [Pseudomonas sp. LTJR-52]|nr:hypothetical protein EAW52_25035 [Pseudomonas sp. LTJR-52]